MNGTIPVSFSAPASGLYTRTDLFSTPAGFEQQVVETVRLDVDGPFPQDIVSGKFSSSLYSSSFGSVEWIANRLVETSADTWKETIVRKYGDAGLLPHSSVRVQVPHRFNGMTGWKMTITFMGGAPEVSRVLRFASPYFRSVEFEFDTVETASRVTSVDTWAHPSRPSHLPHEELSLGDVAGEAPMRSAAADGGGIATVAARPDDARRMLHDALLADAAAAVETFGAFPYRHHLQTFAKWLTESGDTAAAAAARHALTQICPAHDVGPAEPGLT